MNFRIDSSFCLLTSVNWMPCRVSFVQTTVPAASSDTPETGNRNDSRTVSLGCKLEAGQVGHFKVQRDSGKRLLSDHDDRFLAVTDRMYLRVQGSENLDH